MMKSHQLIMMKSYLLSWSAPQESDYEAKLQKKVQTSGCAQGTIYGDIMEEFEAITLQSDMQVKASDLYALSAAINAIPSLY